MHALPPRFYPALFVALWATGFIGARYAMPHAEPFHFLFARFALTGIILTAAAVFLKAPMIRPAEAVRAMIAGVLMHGAYLGGVFWAVRNGMPAGLSALIVGLQPLITAFMARAALGDAITARHWSGLAIGFLGVGLVLSPKLSGLPAAFSAPQLAACALAVIAMSAGTVWQKKHGQGASPVTAAIWQYAGGAALMLPLALLTENGAYELTGELVFAMAWLVLVLSIGAIFLLMRLIAAGEIARVASLFYLVPGVTAILAWILFGEALGPVQILGMALAAAGVALAQSGFRLSTPR